MQNPARTVARIAGGLGIAAVATVAIACSSSTNATATPENGAAVDCPTTGEEFETARLYIEHNATDEDTGVHGLFGGVA
ncbi:MAG: hypothetical protein O3A10_02820 [Chloroflexi bacterium]|nr:hypothetical protein [Chloroflexota bacterium]MDA1145161.1 hypothetical protein [Chloroflexota bacterium]